MSKTRIINISRLLELARCQQRYYWRWHKGIVPEEEKEDNLAFGTAMHKFVEVWMQTWNAEKALKAFHASLPKGFESEDEFESREYGDLLCREYAKVYAGDKKKFGKVESIEEDLSVEIPDAGLILVGRPDAVVRVKEGVHKGLWHLQTKTASGSRGVGEYITTYTTSWHERAYKLMIEQKYKETCRGTILNLIRKLSPGKVATKAQIEDASVELVLGRRIRDENWQPFVRFEQALGEKEIERFELDMIAAAGMLEDAEKTGLWMRNPGACMDYHRTCAYLGPCRGMPTTLGGWKKREKDYVDKQKGMAE